jgi:hypothetical protein
VPDPAFLELLQTYRVAARAHGVASAQGKHKEANRHYASIVESHRKLRANDALHELRHLLTDDDPSVRLWAASHFLEVDLSSAERVLAELAASGGLIGFGAAMTLREWNADRLQFP